MASFRSGDPEMRFDGFLTPCLLVAIFLSGCAHVDANYPEPDTRPESIELPDEHVIEGTYTDKTYSRLVWRREGEIHGFQIYWEDCADMVNRMERAIDGRNPEAAKDARRFARMDDRGYGHLSLWLYVAPQVDLLVRRGDLRIIFEDGTSTSSTDIFLYPVVNRPDPFQSTASGPVLISGKADPYQQGRHCYIFVDDAWLDRTVASVEFGDS
jgi:hypothetical protein